ncbi:MAG: arsenate reductase ArsC [Anaerolineales bacterium]
MNKDINSISRKVLFLCTGNSCRSQMAEAIVNANSQDYWLAYSAGTKPTQEVHPLTIKVLAEINVQHKGHSKSITEFKDEDFDLVVTVCDSAVEDCPVWLKSGRQIHHSFPDPAAFHGSSVETLAVFRQVRDDILQEIPRLLRNLNSESSLD